MKIGYLIQEGAPNIDVVSGPQLHIRAVIKGLEKHGHSVRTFMPRGGQLYWSDDLSQNEWQKGAYGFSKSFWFRCIESPMRRAQTELHLPYLNLFESIRYSDAAARALSHCDLIFERYGFMGYGGVITAGRLGIPSVLEINGDISKEMEVLNVKMSAGQYWASARIARLTMMAASGIVCVAPLMKKKLVERIGIRSEKVQVIPNGADVELFSAPQDPVRVREKYGIACRPTMTFVGSFQPWHGIDLLLDSFNGVMEKITDAQLLLVGDGPGRSEAERRVSTSRWDGSVHFMGRLENSQVAEILAITDVSVAPFPYASSDIVGSPLKLFEYMAAGCPVIASWAPIHDVIEHEVNGIRVEPANASALADQLVRLLSNPTLSQRLGANAQRMALERYSWDNTIQQLEDFFQRLRVKHAAWEPGK